MMKITDALMFAPAPISVFNALIWWNGPTLPASSTARPQVPAPAPKYPLYTATKHTPSHTHHGSLPMGWVTAG